MRCTTSPRRRPRAPTSSPRLGGRSPRPPDHVRLDLEDHLRRCRVAFLAASKANIAWYLGHLGNGSIGPDKVNHLRHVQFFGSPQGVRDHMAEHRAIIAPKFDEVDRVFSERLGGIRRRDLEQARRWLLRQPRRRARHGRRAWSRWPRRPGIALTPAGSSFPHGDDPNDANIRIAPTMPPLEEVTVAIDAVATCVLLAAAEQLTGTAQG